MNRGECPPASCAPNDAGEPGAGDATAPVVGRPSRAPFPLQRSLAFALTAVAVACSEGDRRGGDALASIPAIVFVKRAHTVTDPATGRVRVAVTDGNMQVVDFDRYVPGGGLYLLSPPRPDGTLVNLTAAFPEADVSGVDVSFDAREAVFSMKRDAADHYQLYTVSLVPDAAGRYELHAKTGGPSNKIDPVYLAGRRIAFVTDEMYTAMGTRADEYEHARVVTQLATISADGGDADLRLFAQNLSHSCKPFPRHDGKVGYSRWEHLGPLNDVKLMAANPDGTNMIAVAGQQGKPSNSLVGAREVAPNVLLAVATSRNRTLQAGALVRIDARNKADPACLEGDPMKFAGHACLDPEGATFENLTPDVPLGSSPSPVGRYRRPAPLADGRILTAWADGPVNDLAEQSASPPDFGIYVYDPTTRRNQLVYNDTGVWDLDPLPVVPRAEPPLVGEAQRTTDPGQPTRIGSVDITQTNLDERVSGGGFESTPMAEALKQAVRVRVVEGFSSEGAPGVTMFGLTMHEGAAVLGEVEVQRDGSWLADIPPYLPVHLQPLDKFGMAIRNQLTWIQGMPGEDRRCVGCHESRTGTGVPRFGSSSTLADQKPVAQLTAAIADRLEYPWDKVQALFDAKCVRCHDGQSPDDPHKGSYRLRVPRQGDAGVPDLDAGDGGEGGDGGVSRDVIYEIPYFRLTRDPITVTYDREAKTYPVSYVSIFYPAAMAMDMGPVTVEGDVPPTWGVPGNARQSVLLERINLRADDGATAWPESDHPLHPENKGVTLTADERAMLVRVMDLGGQYYARQNTGFVPFARDPVAPGGSRYGGGP